MSPTVSASQALAGKVVIEVRGNEATLRDRNRHVPWTAAEIAADAARCQDAGASIYHFHARTGTGASSGELADYAEVIRRTRAACDILVHPTLGASSIPDPEARVAHIPKLASSPDTRPDIAPVDLGSFNIDPYDAATKSFRNEDLVYRTSVRGLRHEIDQIRGAGVAVQAVLWTVGSARLLDAFLDMGVLASPALAEITLSNGWLSAHPVTLRGLETMVEFLPRGRDVVWTVGGYAANLLPLVSAAIELGGGVSIGLGDYPYRELGEPTNADVVAEVARIVRACGRQPATPGDLRDAFGW